MKQLRYFGCCVIYLSEADGFLFLLIFHKSCWMKVHKSASSSIVVVDGFLLILWSSLFVKRNTQQKNIQNNIYEKSGIEWLACNNKETFLSSVFIYRNSIVLLMIYKSSKAYFQNGKLCLWHFKENPSQSTFLFCFLAVPLVDNFVANSWLHGT